MKLCVRCETWIHEDNFYRDRNTCKFCLAGTAVKRRQDTKYREVAMLLRLWKPVR